MSDLNKMKERMLAVCVTWITGRKLRANYINGVDKATNMSIWVDQYNTMVGHKDVIYKMCGLVHAARELSDDGLDAVVERCVSRILEVTNMCTTDEYNRSCITAGLTWNYETTEAKAGKYTKELAKTGTAFINDEQMCMRHGSVYEIDADLLAVVNDVLKTDFMTGDELFAHILHKRYNVSESVYSGLRTSLTLGFRKLDPKDEKRASLCVSRMVNMILLHGGWYTIWLNEGRWEDKKDG